MKFLNHNQLSSLVKVHFSHSVGLTVHFLDGVSPCFPVSWVNVGNIIKRSYVFCDCFSPYFAGSPMWFPTKGNNNKMQFHKLSGTSYCPHITILFTFIVKWLIKLYLGIFPKYAKTDTASSPPPQKKKKKLRLSNIFNQFTEIFGLKVRVLVRSCSCCHETKHFKFHYRCGLQCKRKYTKHDNAHTYMYGMI